MLTLIVSAALAAVPGLELQTLTHKGDRYSVASVDLSQLDLDLYGAPDGIDLDKLKAIVAKEERELLVAANGGMFQRGYGAVGLAVGKGVKHPVAEGGGDGNFYLLPNGIFLIDDQGARTIPTTSWTDHPVRLATQSGPMLVVGGEIHPAFKPESANKLIRNGVCAPTPAKVHLVISESGVRFHDFATLMRDVLGCSDALFLDATVSMMHTVDQPMEVSGSFAVILAATRPQAPPKSPPKP